MGLLHLHERPELDILQTKLSPIFAIKTNEKKDTHYNISPPRAAVKRSFKGKVLLVVHFYALWLAKNLKERSLTFSQSEVKYEAFIDCFGGFHTFFPRLWHRITWHFATISDFTFTLIVPLGF